MKKYLVLAFFAICALGVNAQDFKPFQLYLGLGYAIPADGGGGILIDLEPAYRINDALAVGLRLESAAMAKTVGTTEASIAGVGSYTVNGKYYLSNNTFRPYVGAGLGLYNLAAVSTSANGGSFEGGSSFGFYPRIGFDLGHFNLNIDYNIIGSSQVQVTAGDAPEIKNSYIGIRIGGFFFGGKN